MGRMPLKKGAFLMSETKITTYEDKLVSSYLTQHYRFNDQTIAPADAPNPELPDGFIISAWSPNGKRVTLKENVAANWELEKAIKNLNKTPTKITTIEATRAWVEDSIFIENITKSQAKALAKKFKQLAFIELKAGQAILHQTNSKRTIKTNLDYKPTEYGCPARKKPSKEFCEPHGFWTTGQAIAALGRWQENLTVVTSRLGCNLCHSVTSHPNFLVKIRHDDAITVTNRYSIAQWVRL